MVAAAGPTASTPPPPPGGPPPVAPRHPDRRPPPSPPSTATRFAFLVVGGALTAFVLVSATLAAVNSISVHTDVAEVAWDRPVRAVRIETGGGSVDIRGTETDQVRGSRRVQRGLQAPTVTEEVVGDTLVLTSGCTGLAVPWCSASYTLDVPRSVRVEVSTGTGKVTVRGTTGGLRADTGTGHLEVWDLDGPLALETGIGGIEARDLRSEEVAASTGTGSALVSFTSPPRSVTAESGTGRVEILVPRDGTPYRVDEESGSGRTRIEVPTDPSSDRVIRVTSGAGDVLVGHRG